MMDGDGMGNAPLSMAPFWGWIKKNFAELAQAIQALATVAALIIGGIWTYQLFVLQRLAYPHLKIEHSVSDISFPDNRILLVVDVTHVNSGNVRIALPLG